MKLQILVSNIVSLATYSHSQGVYSFPTTTYQHRPAARFRLHNIRRENRHLFRISEEPNQIENSHDDSNNATSQKSKHVSSGKLRRRRIHYHSESHITAAGAEPLFSHSLWSSSFSFAVLFRDNIIKRLRPQNESSYSTASADTFLGMQGSSSDIELPSIDCQWACRSDAEILKLQQMKYLLQNDTGAIIPDENLQRLYPDVYGDFRLLRFLRKSSDGDPVSASERYRSFLLWRREMGVDKIRELVESNYKVNNRGYFDPADDRLKAVAEYFPCNFDSVLASNEELGAEDVGGTKPAVLYVGSWDTCGITERILRSSTRQSCSGDGQTVLSLSDFLDYWIYLYEAIHVHLYKQSIELGEMAYLDEICDLTNLTLRQFSPNFVRNVMKPWLRVTQSFYPETTRRIYVLNPPAIVNVAWNLVTPLLSKGTLEKVRFVRDLEGSADDFCASGRCV